MKKVVVVFLLIAVFSWKQCKKTTYTNSIMPIIHQKCSPCHNPKGAGPFSLLTHNDVVKNHKMIAYVINEGIMPPWKADLDKNNFKGMAKLTDTEISLINSWMEKGMPKSHEVMERPPVFETKKINHKPTLLLKPSKHFKLEASDNEYYVTYYFPLNNKEELNVSLYNLKVDNKKLLHHAWIFIEEGKGEYSGLKWGDLITKHLNSFDIDMNKFYTNELIYTPGDVPHAYDYGYATKIKPNSTIILQYHYKGTGKLEVDKTFFELYTTSLENLTEIKTLMLDESHIENQPFETPANQVKSFSQNYFINKDIYLFKISNHMHYRGKSAHAYAVTANYDTINLLTIPKWEFDWQGIYTYETPVFVPKNSTICIESVIDNRNSNIRNPVSPPINAVYGVTSNDEMLRTFFFYSDQLK
jgi:hypothetical protein